jgi:hypothetical protein
LLDPFHLTTPATGRAGYWRCSWLRAAAVAAIACFRPAKFDIPFGAEHRLFERNGQVIAQIAAAAWTTTLAPAPTKRTAEEFFKDIGYAAEIPFETETWAAIVKTGMAETIVGSAFLIVGEHFICLADLFEPFVGVGILADIRVVLSRKPAIRLF